MLTGEQVSICSYASKALKHESEYYNLVSKTRKTTLFSAPLPLQSHWSQLACNISTWVTAQHIHPDRFHLLFLLNKTSSTLSISAESHCSILLTCKKAGSCPGRPNDLQQLCLLPFPAASCSVTYSISVLPWILVHSAIQASPKSDSECYLWPTM